MKLEEYKLDGINPPNKDSAWRGFRMALCATTLIKKFHPRKLYNQGMESNTPTLIIH